MTKIFVLSCVLFLAASGFVHGSHEKKKKDDIKLFELKKGDFSIKVTNWGATLVSVILPDKNGVLGDIVLGYDSPKAYTNDSSYFGATVGRVGNRIGGAQFTLNGVHYKLVANEGNNTLHSGPKAFSDVLWNVEKYVKDGDRPRITFSYLSFDGEGGFPGDLLVTVSYILGKNSLSIIMKAKALNKPTPVNLLNHAYWNLGNHNSGNILNEVVQIFGSQVTLLDDHLIPTGKFASVKGTPYDFLEPHRVGERINQLPKTNGYDINYVLDGAKGKEIIKLGAIVVDKKSGRVMKLFTNAPGLQFYTANFVENDKGKDSGNIRATNLCSNFNSLHCGKTLLRHRHNSPYFSMPPSSSTPPSFTSWDETGKRSKKVWIWTTNKQGEVLDEQNKRVATIFDVSNPEELEGLRPEDEEAESIVVNLLDWQVIPAENIIAAFQRSQKTVLAISNNTSEAQVFLEALEHGLDGIVMKIEDVEPVHELKAYFDRRMEESNLLSLTKATVTHIQVAGMGDRVCVDLCSLMRPGEGLLIGSFARGLFLVHSECLESNYIASRPFRVNAGPVHAYVAVPGSRTSYLSELKSGKEVIVVDQQGHQRIAIVGRVKIESRPLILVEAKIESDNQTISILLQNAETVALVCPPQGNTMSKTTIPVTSLKVGDEIVLRVQGGARHTGIEIQEFIVEK
ncbi:aldose 1-epimerase [Vigna unguiculata]|uniref:Aldose 1-epimerase n=1 Tax=Vigna unguiculata TaxID=3917 RepID=A0A4D6LXG6_VIGUN|nr:aldose 1-epimerase [Vigna unguiculata]